MKFISSENIFSLSFDVYRHKSRMNGINAKTQLPHFTWDTVRQIQRQNDVIKTDITSNRPRFVPMDTHYFYSCGSFPYNKDFVNYLSYSSNCKLSTRIKHVPKTEIPLDVDPATVRFFGQKSSNRSRKGKGAVEV